MRAIPIADPTLRVVSFMAEATPCCPRPREPVMAAVLKAPQARQDQAAEEGQVAGVDAEEGYGVQAGGEQEQADGQDCLHAEPVDQVWDDPGMWAAPPVRLGRGRRRPSTGCSPA